jgi:hypothetical protein
MAIVCDRSVHFPLRPGIPTRCLSRKYAIVENYLIYQKKQIDKIGDGGEGEGGYGMI